MRSFKWYGAVLILGMLALLFRPAYAVLATCSASATGVAFGPYDVFSATPTEATGDISVSCTGLVVSVLISYDIQLSPGSSGAYSARALVSGPHSLAYNLYTDSIRTVIWGDGSSGTSTVSDGYALGLFTVTRQYPVYGRIPARQNAFVGSYNDTLIVTVNY